MPFIPFLVLVLKREVEWRERSVMLRIENNEAIVSKQGHPEQRKQVFN